MASLFVIQGADQGHRFELERPVYTLGRDAVNDIQLHDTEVSRRHAEIRQTPDGFVLNDSGSSNGTFVNTERWTETRALSTGDRVQLGRTVLLFTAATFEDDDLSEAIQIVGGPAGHDGSRILKSISHASGSNILDLPQAGESAWLARARSNLQVMYRTSLAVSHTLDIDELLNRIIELIFEWVEADRGCIMLTDQATGQLHPKARRQRKGSSPSGRGGGEGSGKSRSSHSPHPSPLPEGEGFEAITISRTILDFVMDQQEGVLTSDAKDDGRWDAGGSIVTQGVREAICVPMQGRYGIVGVIYIDTFTEPGRRITSGGANKFNEEHLRLMVAIGHQAALAVEDTSYYSAMVQAERLAAVGQAIAALSHHIKNILQGIRGGSYLIEEGLKEDEAAKMREVVGAGWQIVEKNQDKISNLVLDMLTFSKEREPDPVPADLNQVAADVVELMQTRANDLGVKLSLSSDVKLPTLKFDPEGLHRATLNVVTNAIDAASDGDDGAVEVATSLDRESGMARITVADNGSGIAAEDIDKMFTMFESTKGHRGTGLGLPVSQKILQEHGGQIQVESVVGEGSQFILAFPAQYADATPNGGADTIHPGEK